MLPLDLRFGTPRKLPRVEAVPGRVVVLDVAFAGGEGKQSFDKLTLPFIRGLGQRLRRWVDHHDHEDHVRFAADPRFLLRTKAQHGACPEMLTPDLVEGTGPVDTVLCHVDFDGLASAAKWMRGGHEPYAGCDDDARAIDTRIGTPSERAVRMDRAIRARPKDEALLVTITELLFSGAEEGRLFDQVDAAAAALIPVERETRRVAARYQRLADVAFVDLTSCGAGRVDKTELLLAGQRLAPVSVVADRDTVNIAAAFDSGRDFLALFGLGGGMPTRVAVPRARLVEVLVRLGVHEGEARLLAG